MTLPARLPKRLAQLAIQPTGLPDDEVAWTRTDALSLLDALIGLPIAVSAVDAYILPPGLIEVMHTGRRAVFMYGPGELALQFAHRSRQLATEFVESGDDAELFVLALTDQDDADEAYGRRSVLAG